MATQTMTETATKTKTTSTKDTPESTSKPQRLPITVSKPTPYTFDLGHLLCTDPNPLPPHPTDADLASAARDGAQALINQLLSTCAIASTSAGVLLTLPPPTTALPREKPLPSEKQATRWERFAAKKGIKDRKRGEGKMVYEEGKGEWVPKWGYKGRNKEGEGEWLVEVDERKEGKEGAGNVRGAGRRERKEAVRRNERKQRANDRSRRQVA